VPLKRKVLYGKIILPSEVSMKMNSVQLRYFV